jgi:hypothetical protein
MILDHIGFGVSDYERDFRTSPRARTARRALRVERPRSEPRLQ